ncbi:MAG: hypothetical protein ACR2QE_17125 [Acidimicrobiales bacterium]
MVIAHEGGWDEALFVAVPVVVFFLLLVLANRRANQLRTEHTDTDDETLDDGEDTDSHSAEAD